MKKQTREQLNKAIDDKIGELRALPAFTGVYLSESADGAACIVVQLDPMTDDAKRRAQQLLADCPVQFRNIGIAEAQ